MTIDSTGVITVQRNKVFTHSIVVEFCTYGFCVFSPVGTIKVVCGGSSTSMSYDNT